MPCNEPGCIDCTTRRFVTEMKQRQNVESATQTHWPDDPNGGRDKRDEDAGEGLDNEGRPRDPDKGDAHVPTPPPPD